MELIGPQKKIEITWKIFFLQLPDLNYIRIPQNLLTENSRNSQNTIGLHGFTDASMKAYGAAVYI